MSGSEPRDDDRHEGARGRLAQGPAEITRLGWKDILHRLYWKFWEDRAMLVAGGVTFYLLLALFPALAAFVSLFGLIADPASLAGGTAVLDGVLPDDAADMLREELTQLASKETGTLTFGLVLSLLFALWTANNGVKAIFEALNIVYNEQEKRSLLWLHVVSFAFTLGGMALGAILVGAVALVPAILAFVDLGPLADAAVRAVRWALLLPVIAAVIALLYRFGPSRAPARWRWLSWGSGMATLVWLLASIGYSFYLQNFANYQATYGSLGALVGFLLWIWLSVLILVVGAEVNAEMEHQTRCDTTLPPTQKMGERGAYMADTLGRPSG
jgi:membrane protein